MVNADRLRVLAMVIVGFGFCAAMRRRLLPPMLGLVVVAAIPAADSDARHGYIPYKM
jgi:hypothetical protein